MSGRLRRVRVSTARPRVATGSSTTARATPARGGQRVAGRRRGQSSFADIEKRLDNAARRRNRRSTK